MYRVETTNKGKFAVVDCATGKTVHLTDHEFTARMWVDNLNRSHYEPVIDPYAPACGRWDKPGTRKAYV
jgi:hypothetical protein